MRMLAIIALLSLSSCAHQTINQYCTEHESEYKDYEQCYQEVKEERQSAKASKTGAFLKGFSDGYNARPAPQPTSCYNIGGIINCH